MLRLIFIYLTLTLSTFCLEAQDENASGTAPLDIKGNIRLSSQVYHSNNPDNFRTSPISYGISGNLSLSVGNIKVPLSLVYRDNSFSLNRPFFYLGASPKLGPVQFHIGNRNLNFSQYTLGGASFFGIGAEMQTGMFRFGAMTGSFQNPFAQRDSIVYGSIEIPTFNRKGYSFKVGVGKKNSFLDLIFLRIKDEYHNNNEFEENPFNPKDNLVLGVKYHQNIGRKFRFKIDAAASALTSDLSYDFITIDDPIVEDLRNFLDINPTTQLSFAGDAEVQLRLKRFKSSVLYRRIYPHYISLGSSYITPDKEEYLIKLSGGFLKNRVRLISSLGWQRNNLLNQRTITSNRLVGSLVLLLAPKNPFRATIMYTNYDISNRPTIIEENDSLKIVRVMNQLKLSPSYRIDSDNISHHINGSISYRVINGQYLQESRESKNSFVNIGYGLRYKPWQLYSKININYNQSNNYSFTRDRYGGSFTLSKSMFEKALMLSINNSYFKNLINDKIDGDTYRSALVTNYSILKSHRLQFSLNYITRSSVVFQNKKDIQIRTNYTYAF